MQRRKMSVSREFSKKIPEDDMGKRMILMVVENISFHESEDFHQGVGRGGIEVWGGLGQCE